VLPERSNRYDHLREVTRDDVFSPLDTVQGSQRQASAPHFPPSVEHGCGKATDVANSRNAPPF